MGLFKVFNKKKKEPAVKDSYKEEVKKEEPKEEIGEEKNEL